MDSGQAIENPFPGPQPYRAGDRGRFFGRGDLAYKLESSVRANRCLTVFGPSGAGKSSLVQASVIPSLIDAYDARVVRVDGWPDDVAPASWLARAMYAELGYRNPPDGMAPDEAIVAAAKRAARASPRPLLVYLDQIEQLLYSNRDDKASEALFACVHELVELPLRNIRVMLSLREDYLGRFRDRLRDRRRILDYGFRVGPLTVEELTDAVCLAAAAGKPPQRWDSGQMRALMMQVRVPGQGESGDAEAQAAYAQIVCRALFQARAPGDGAPSQTMREIEAEPIVRHYLETTLASLDGRRDSAQRLLEDHLVTVDGGRTLRTENELLRVLPEDDLFPILRVLEGAAILHAEEHQGSRYFELGHDWLAKKVHEERQAREHAEERNRREEEQRRELARQRAEAEAKSAKERAARKRLRVIAGLSLGVAGAMGGLGFCALTETNVAREQTRIAEEEKMEARDAKLMAVFRDMRARGELAWGMKLLAEVSAPERRRGWVEMASDALDENALIVTLSGAGGPLRMAAFSPDGQHILTASTDWKARIYDVSGKGLPIVLKGHTGPIHDAAYSADGRWIVTASDDHTARIWEARKPEHEVVLEGHGEAVNDASFSPDGLRVVTASDDKTLRVWKRDGSEPPIVLQGHEGAVNSAVYDGHGGKIVSASDDQTVRVWDGEPQHSPVILRGHEGSVRLARFSPDGKRIVSASADGTARVWEADGKGEPIVLRHLGPVNQALWSPDGQWIATASQDGMARIWHADGTGEPVVLKGHEGPVNAVAFSPDELKIATASDDGSVRVWLRDGTGIPWVLRGHGAAVQSLMFRPDGRSLLSAAADLVHTASNANTAKLWDMSHVRVTAQRHAEKEIMHAAFIAADGDTVISALDNNSARMWHIHSSADSMVFRGHEQWITSAALSSDGKRVLTASLDGTLRVWRVDGHEEHVIQGPKTQVHRAVFSPDGTKIAVVSDESSARIYNSDGTGSVIELSGHKGWLTSVDFSRDGRKVATGSFDRTVRVWDANGSGTSVVLSGHTEAVRAVAFSPDGGRVASASMDRSVMIRNANGAGDPIVLSGHRGGVIDVFWSTDGARVAAVSLDQAVYIWSANGVGEPIVVGGDEPLIAAAFVDQGQRVLMIGRDYHARTYMINGEELKNRLKSAHLDCVPPQLRMSQLGESEFTSWEQFSVCERANGRIAAAASDVQLEARRTLEQSEASETLVNLTVFPGDAIVEVDGLVAQRRDGVIDLFGKIGETRRVRVFHGALQREWDVMIGGSGASPTIIRLEETSKGKN